MRDSPAGGGQAKQPKCNQCDQPGFFLVGPTHIPLCLDCNEKLQRAIDAQTDSLERQLNHTAALMEMQMGMPGLIPRYPPRSKPVVQHSGPLNNITINQ